MQRYPMTPAGLEALRHELAQRTKIDRPRITNAIAEARAHGDLKENAEYHAAREEQGLNEARISDIEGRISAAQVIDITSLTPSNKVVFGTTVTILNCATDKSLTWRIVGEDEADVAVQKLSVTSPIARALMGKEVDDIVTVTTPSGDIDYEIEVVEYV